MDAPHQLLNCFALVGVAGGILVSLLLADTIDATSPSGTAAMRTAIGHVASAVVVPSLIADHAADRQPEQCLGPHPTR